MVTIIILLVQYVKVPFLLALIIGLAIYFLINILFDPKMMLLTYYLNILSMIAVMTSTFRGQAAYVISFLRKHPDKASLYIIEDNETILDYGGQEIRPLASMLKVIIAITYAKQAVFKEVNKNEKIKLSELDTYYYAGTDGGMHLQWLQTLGNRTEVTLHEVAQGMMTFSSNANTEFLLKKLQLKEINKTIDELELTDHDDITPLVAPLYLLNEKQKDVRFMEKVKEKDFYDKAVMQVYEQLMHGEIDLKKSPFNLSLSKQKIWSDNLPKSSARTYAHIYQAILNDHFSKRQNEILHDLLEWPMLLSKKNEENFKHLGSKGGSTAFVYNNGIYSETKTGKQIISVIMTEELSWWQWINLNLGISDFEAKIHNDPNYREKVIQALKA